MKQVSLIRQAYVNVTHFAGYVLAVPGPHQLHWNGQEVGGGWCLMCDLITLTNLRLGFVHCLV